MKHTRAFFEICTFAALLFSAGIAAADQPPTADGNSRTYAGVPVETGGWYGSKAAMDVWTQDLNYYVLGDNRINRVFGLGGDAEKQKALYDGLEGLVLGQSIDVSSLAANSGLQLTTTQYNAMIEDAYLACEASRTPYHVCNRIVASLAPFEHAVATK